MPNFSRHRITNAVAEGLNSKVATIQNMAAGFGDGTLIRITVLFKRGDLSLYPATPKKADELFKGLCAVGRAGVLRSGPPFLDR